LAAFIAAGLLTYVYWDKVRTVLGLEHHTFLPQLFSRVQDNDYERVIQVCVWRVDLASDPDGKEVLSNNRAEELDNSQVQESSSLFCGSTNRLDPRTAWMPMLPLGDVGGGLWKAEEDMSTIRTTDGRTPSISIQLCYGSETLQYTRTVRPTWNEWRSKGPVYIQENFKISLDWRPGVPLRVEVRDVEAALGSTSLGEVDFDSAKLHRQLELSKKAVTQFTDVPVVQVIRMLEPPVPSSMPAERQRNKTNDLKAVGFQQHGLSGGGAVWLAFSDIAKEKQDAFSCC